MQLSCVNHSLLARIALLVVCVLMVRVAVAQQRYAVGQSVEVYCNCLGPTAWIPGTIEEDQGNGRFRVRYGTGRYDYQNGISAENIRDPRAGERDARQDERRRLFEEEAKPYRASVGAVASLFDPTLDNATVYGVPSSAADWARVMKDLTALNEMCTTKYPLLKNPQDNSGQRNIFQMPATWCEIAAARSSFQSQAGLGALQSKIDVNVMLIRNQLQRSIDEPRNSAPDDVQKLLFEPEIWKAELMKLIGAPGTPFPAVSLASIQEKSDELKSLIEQGAPNRHWEQPGFNRPVEQGMAKAKFVSYYSGVTVLKIGSSFTDWKMYKNSLGIPTNRFIRGWALLKLPNRPYCQAQEWIVKQTYSGGGGWSAAKVDSFGGGGVFMNCN